MVQELSTFQLDIERDSGRKLSLLVNLDLSVDCARIDRRLQDMREADFQCDGKRCQHIAAVCWVRLKVRMNPDPRVPCAGN